MVIETKFKLGQKVFGINKCGENKYAKCKACNGAGGVYVNDSYFECTSCYGRGSNFKWIPEEWKVTVNGSKIGRIDTEFYHPKEKRENKITYMLYETGVGSGTLWDESQIFATFKEAAKECERKNVEEKLMVS
jgi:hypothetical protein